MPKNFDFRNSLNDRQFADMQKQIIKHGLVISLVNLFDENHTPYYVYLSVKASRYQEFLSKMAKGPFAFTEYGEVICDGIGLMPSPKVKAEIKEKYGFDTDQVLNFQSQMLEKYYGKK